MSQPPSQYRLPVIGITGGAGSGKSALAHELLRFGATIVSGDEMGRRAVESSLTLRRALVRRFGESILTKRDWRRYPIDRRALAAVAFADDESTDTLNAIVHPRLLKLLKAEVHRLSHSRYGNGHRSVIIDAALLGEWGDTVERDYLIAVWAPRRHRIDRLLKKRYSRQVIQNLFRRQLSDRNRLMMADLVVRNDAGLDKLARSARQIAHWVGICD